MFKLMMVVETGSYVDISGFCLLEEMLDNWSMFLTGKVALGFHTEDSTEDSTDSTEDGGLKMGVTNCISSAA